MNLRETYGAPLMTLRCALLLLPPSASLLQLCYQSLRRRLRSGGSPNRSALGVSSHTGFDIMIDLTLL
jgi:hypothetical protein